DPHHYCAVISSRHPETEEPILKQAFLMVSRSLVMTPDNDANLERFLRSYSQFGVFFLLPGLKPNAGTPELFTDLAILKRGLVVKLAAEVGEHDIEAIALRRPLGH